MLSLHSNTAVGRSTQPFGPHKGHTIRGLIVAHTLAELRWVFVSFFALIIFVVAWFGERRRVAAWQERVSKEMDQSKEREVRRFAIQEQTNGLLEEILAELRSKK